MLMGAAGSDSGVERQTQQSRGLNFECRSHGIGLFDQMHESEKPKARDWWEKFQQLPEILAESFDHFLLHERGEGELLIRQRHEAPDPEEGKACRRGRGTGHAARRAFAHDRGWVVKSRWLRLCRVALRSSEEGPEGAP